MKKILIITPYEDQRGGVEIVTGILANSLKEKGIVCDYLTIGNLNHYPYWLRFVAKIFGEVIYTSWKYRKIDSTGYDAVICNGEYSWLIKHKNAYTYFHGSYKGLIDAKRKQINLRNFVSMSLRSWQQFMGAKGKKTVSASAFLKKILESQNINVDYVISNPIDCRKFIPLEIPRSDFLYVGRNDGYAKGFDVLNRLANHQVKITCVTDKNPNGKLMFYPFVKNDELPNIYNKFKIKLFFSRFESFGMAAAEALSCGLPVLMFEVGFAEQLKKEIPEFVLNEQNSSDEVILKRIDVILKDYEFFSKKARDFAVENFSKDVFVNEWIKILKI